MNVSAYLIITKNVKRYGASMRLAQREPRSMGSNEVCLRLSLDIPDALFQRPILEARMKIPNEAVPKTVITPTITDNIEKIIKEATGLNLHVTVVEHITGGEPTT